MNKQDEAEIEARCRRYLEDQNARIALSEARRAHERAKRAEWAATEPDGDYRAGFIAGYLRAHQDGQEYDCSVEWAVLMFGQFLSEGGRALPVEDVGG